jgi:hypothetical protein
MLSRLEELSQTYGRNLPAKEGVESADAAVG